MSDNNKEIDTLYSRYPEAYNVNFGDTIDCCESESDKLTSKCKPSYLRKGRKPPVILSEQEALEFSICVNNGSRLLKS